MKLANVVLAGALSALVLTGPARGESPEGTAAPEGAAAPEATRAVPAPYAYPASDVPSADWVPPDGWRYPALAGDVLLVRPVMLLSLIGSGALFVATLPVSAATSTTDDWLHTLRDQVAYTFQRPLGAF